MAPLVRQYSVVGETGCRQCDGMALKNLEGGGIRLVGYRHGVESAERQPSELSRREISECPQQQPHGH